MVAFKTLDSMKPWISPWDMVNNQGKLGFPVTLNVFQAQIQIVLYKLVKFGTVDSILWSR